LLDQAQGIRRDGAVRGDNFTALGYQRFTTFSGARVPNRLELAPDPHQLALFGQP